LRLYMLVFQAIFYGMVSDCEELVAPSEEASRQKCDKLLYVSMGGALVRVSPQSLHLDQGLSFRNKASFEGNVWPYTHVRGKSSTVVNQLFFLTEKCGIICSSQSTYGNGVFFSIGCYFIS